MIVIEVWPLMCRNDLPRIYEIHDGVRSSRPGSYFQDFEKSLVNYPVKRKHFLDIETDLAGLDTGAWTQLKAQVVPLFEKKHPIRGWQAAFDKLNEAKAYNYLVKLGCTELAFIPVSSKSGRKTPDLKGALSTEHVLCEVKTINPSDDEAKARGQMITRAIQGRLPAPFFAKLTNALKTADAQMSSYRPNAGIRKIVYVILNFDDNLHEYVENYLVQLRDFYASAELPNVEIIFDVKPKFYSATYESSPSQLFACTAGNKVRPIPEPTGTKKSDLPASRVAGLHSA